MIGALLTKIAGAVFQKAASFAFLSSIASAYEIFSVVESISDLSDCLATVSDCDPLGVCGVEVVSDHLSNAALEQILKKPKHSFKVEKRKSGIYIVSQLAPSFQAHGIDFPKVRHEQPKTITSTKTIIAPGNKTKIYLR